MTLRLAPAAVLLLSACAPLGSALVRPLELPIAAVPDSREVAEGVLEAEQVWQRERPPALADRDTLRFVALGNLGTRDEVDRTLPHAYARRLADVAATACARQGGCDMIVWLGDVAGADGVNGVADRAFLTELAVTWERVAPVYVVLGDEDWGGVSPTVRRSGRLLDWLSDMEGAVDSSNPEALRLRGDSHFWSFETPVASVHAIDTTFLVRQCTVGAEGSVECPIGANGDALGGMPPLQAIGQDAGHRWTLVFGHHPYRSVGPHGDAGDLRDLGLPIWPGPALAAALDEHVVGVADLYLSAHDHSLQFTADAGGGPGPTGLVVAGASTRAVGRSARTDRVIQHTDPGELGFTMVAATPESLDVRFYTLAHGGHTPRFTSCRKAGMTDRWLYGAEVCAHVEPEPEAEPQGVVQAGETEAMEVADAD